MLLLEQVGNALSVSEGVFSCCKEIQSVKIYDGHLGESVPN